jgi:hypothetical protein
MISGLRRWEKLREIEFLVMEDLTGQLPGPKKPQVLNPQLLCQKSGWNRGWYRGWSIRSKAGVFPGTTPARTTPAKSNDGRRFEHHM